MPRMQSDHRPQRGWRRAQLTGRGSHHHSRRRAAARRSRGRVPSHGGRCRRRCCCCRRCWGCFRCCWRWPGRRRALRGGGSGCGGAGGGRARAGARARRFRAAAAAAAAAGLLRRHQAARRPPTRLPIPISSTPAGGRARGRAPGGGPRLPPLLNHWQWPPTTPRPAPRPPAPPPMPWHCCHSQAAARGAGRAMALRDGGRGRAPWAAGRGPGCTHGVPGRAIEALRRARVACMPWRRWGPHVPSPQCADPCRLIRPFGQGHPCAGAPRVALRRLAGGPWASARERTRWGHPATFERPPRCVCRPCRCKGAGGAACACMHGGRLWRCA